MIDSFKSPSGKSNKEINFFGASLPGQSLTETPKKFPWDKPPRFTDISEAYNYISLQLYTDTGLARIMDLLEMEVSPKTLAKSVVMVGWMRNLWNPDVAEMLNQAIAVDITLIGTEADIDMHFDAPKNINTVNFLQEYKNRKKELSKADDSVIENIQDTLQERAEKISTKKGLMSK